MSWRTTEYDGYVVVAPEDEWHLHDRLLWGRQFNGETEYKCDCGCEPKVILDYDKLLIIHNAFDGRQALEWANEILNKK